MSAEVLVGKVSRYEVTMSLHRHLPRMSTEVLAGRTAEVNSSRRTSFSDPVFQKFKNLFDETMRENDYSKADMFAEVVSDLRKEKKIKVISTKAVENYYNQTTKPDTRTIGAIKAWIELKTREKNKSACSRTTSSNNINEEVSDDNSGDGEINYNNNK
ncbi:8107_t:CDS:2 [Paraglomus occultum]|uniref:8107_t:CDS:1 n=1 Tax=Paraglomus occultum TaxID=144539 RepID=A0A9N8Z916_9GLOM|nr:8107_t:CDS:2 [Paraglomus occultum]